MSYLAIRNWPKYQHKDLFRKSKGRPPWIKFYVDLLEDDELSAQPYSVQLLFDRLLLLAAKKRNAIPSDPEWVAVRVSMKTPDVAEGISALLKGRWLSQTKTPRRSQLIRNSEARKEDKEEDIYPLNPLTQKGRKKIETYVLAVGWQYEDGPLEEELRKQGADDLEVRRLLVLAATRRKESA